MKKIFLVALLLLSSVVASNATSISWNLSGVTFDDGASASGSFDFDATTNSYSNWNILVTGSSDFLAYNYLPDVDEGFSGIISPSTVDFVAFTSVPASGRYLRLSFDSLLTDAGGIVDLMTDNTSFDCYNAYPKRYITEGMVTSNGVAPVPEPGTLALLGLGMAGLAVYGKRRKNSKA